MDQDRRRSFSESRTYAAVRTFYRRAASSRLLSVLGDERVLFSVLAAFVLASVVSVFRSNLWAGIEFLSFVLVFIPLAVLIDRLVYVPAE